MPRKKKQDTVEQENAPVTKKRTSKKETVQEAPVASKEKKTDGRTKEGRREKLQQEYDVLKGAYKDLCKCYSELKVEHDALLERVKTLEVLLAAYNALTHKGEVKFVKPDKGTPYWYIRAMATIKSFEVVSCKWNNWTSDHYRYVKGNMFLDQRTAHMACTAMNAILMEL